MRKEFLSTSAVKTFNGLGHGVWANATGLRLSVEKDGSGRTVKVPNLLREEIRLLPKRAQREAFEQFWDIISAVSLAKSLGYVPEGKFPNAKRLVGQSDFHSRLDEEPTPLLIDLTEQTLTASIKTAYAGTIDFNDQVYMPALFGGTFPNFPTVLVDEKQDLNPVNYEMLRHLKRSRLIAVGDPWQSIYAFRGAVPGGMELAAKEFRMTIAKLSVSFRCPQAVVELARWRAPDMQWVKSGGRVGRLRGPGVSSFPDGAAVICRNNAPLFAAAVKFLNAGRSVTVSGSDIGPKIIGLLRKLGPEEMSREQTLGAIETWRAERLAKESKTANDIADCMCVFANVGDSLGQAVAYAGSILEQEGTINLLTGHKAKGLEWPNVYHLDPWLVREDEQDLNLRYVIQTRALESYLEIESKEIGWAR
jgi:hypothetical protein